MTAPTSAPAEAAVVAAPGFARACVFLSGGQRYGIPVAQVREVAELPHITPVPRTAIHVRGVANLRGVMVPVVDLAQLLGHSRPAPRSVTPTVVLRDGREDVGLIVDRVEGLLPMEPLEPAQAAGPGAMPVQATGAFRSGSHWVVVLDGAALVEALRPPRLRPPEF